ncbi:hypothetical protein [Streptomyces sp. NPDC059994]|uniref:hypothetical protein n=1 Tax=Streptomyces sp. NPDC059994 TaxID=3347029 RepID=UPI0036AF5817
MLKVIAVGDGGILSMTSIRSRDGRRLEPVGPVRNGRLWQASQLECETLFETSCKVVQGKGSTTERAGYVLFEAFQNLVVNELAGEILKVAVPGSRCIRRIVTGAMSIAVIPSLGKGVYTHVVIGDTMAEEEVESIKRLEKDMGYKLADGSVVFHDRVAEPHPHMRGTSEFVQVEFYSEGVSA